MKTLDLLPDNWPADSDWTTHLTPAFESSGFQSLQRFVAGQREQHTVYPPAPDVFNAFRCCPFSKTSVVILGQDPYHGPDQAHGLSFSVQGGCKLPPSLKNIFKELASDLETGLRTNGNLTDWANQGVLLLNTVLTVRAANANSHAKCGWETFTDFVIELLGSQSQQPIVFVLWGKPAEKKASLISGRHRIITAPHPSPLSAHRGFFGSRPFSQINRALIAAEDHPIAWNR